MFDKQMIVDGKLLIRIAYKIESSTYKVIILWEKVTPAVRRE